MNDHFHITGTLQGLNDLVSRLEKATSDWNLSRTQFFEINLILEELCMNYIEHAEKKEENGTINEIEITLTHENSIVQIKITDHGPEFNPTLAADPDVELPLSERKAGGLGLYLVRQYSDRISYTRSENTNTLVIEKKLQ